MIPINQLRIGTYVTPIRTISPARVLHWRYANECGNIGGGLMPGAALKIVETSTRLGAMWIKVEIPGRHPVAYLKISGEEFAMNFRPA